ncbi:unnamed protein product [Cladocopium goreaui]|uniref:Choline transporter-like protein 1 n=1 Tax=Cladocopium goreaui TaxID=2562237 RepID=A0A9P1D3Z1_9DINO|nr:unnamed protein product [Cladocopium goreaui]
MGSGGSVEAAEAAPVPHVRVVLQGLQARISSVEADGVVGEDRIATLKQHLEEALKVCPSGVTDVGPRAASAVQELAKQCLQTAAEVSLSQVSVAELLCEGLAASAAAEVELEPLGEALDAFAVQIMVPRPQVEPGDGTEHVYGVDASVPAVQQMSCLDELIQPEWSMERFGRPGRLCFADCTQPFQPHAMDLRLCQALQGVCAWLLALLFRAGAESLDLSLDLWDFCNSDALSSVCFGKGALSFQRAARETACVRVPHDLPQLQHAILGALLGLGAPRIAFHGAAATGDVDIQQRLEEHLAHCALLTAVAQENGLLDCLLSCDWAEYPGSQLIPALAQHLADTVASTSLKLPEYEDAMKEYLQHLRLRSQIVWDILSLEQQPKRSFLQNCGKLSFYLTPGSGPADALGQAASGGLPDAKSLTWTCVMLVNAGGAGGFQVGLWAKQMIRSRNIMSKRKHSHERLISGY